jgi:thiol-disulfide isomerase/thioredoxin
MKKILLLLLFIATVASSKNEVKDTITTISTVEKFKKTTIEIIDYAGLEKLLSQKDDKIYVVNFWATWCKPCVEELPAFEKMYETYKTKGVELILVSLDFPKHVDSRVIPFVQNHNLKGKIFLMGDPDQNTWIPKVDETWSGAIPATLIYTKNSRKFYEQSFTFNDLQKEIIPLLKSN